jgi:hypothetical protein
MFFIGNQGPVIERDPTIQQLKQNVADRLWDIVKEEPVSTQENKIKFVSFEDALNELIAVNSL